MTLSSLISGAAWTLCRLLPVKKNKVVFSHFYGKGFGDSPKAIALALRDAAPGADIVWLISDPSVALPEGIRPASYAPLSRIYHLSTARVWVDDCRKGARCKKKGQFFLQTWHGFALKQIEQDGRRFTAGRITLHTPGGFPADRSYGIRQPVHDRPLSPCLLVFR